MKKIGIICAGDTEFEAFLPRLKQIKITEKAMLKFYEGMLAGVPVTALFSGVCKVNAAIAAQLLIDAFQVDGIINAGTAGGIDPSIRPFDTVVSEASAYHDVAEEILTDFHPWMESIYFPSDPALLDAARVCSQTFQHPVRFGGTVTGEQFINHRQREELRNAFHPLSADMETAAIAHVCYVNRVPFIAIRTITDTAGHSGGEAFEKNCGTASEISAGFTEALLGQLAQQAGSSAL